MRSEALNHFVHTLVCSTFQCLEEIEKRGLFKDSQMEEKTAGSFVLDGIK